jgi:hypothetical protein
LYLTVTIDTEEDNWGEYDRSAYTVENVERISRLQQVFECRGVRPTYLVTYPVATNAKAVDTLRKYRERGLCEIGAHLHPWNTPPIEEARVPFNTYLNHLPSALQLAKINSLHEVITRSFQLAPTSFRSGRWGFDAEVARNLIRRGYMVDSSISAALDWRPYAGPDFSAVSADPYVYRVEAADGEVSGSLLEVPATSGFVQGRRAGAVYRTLARSWAGGKVLGVLDRLRALNRVCISPELDDAPAMIRLTKALLGRGNTIINMFFHSPSLLEGCSPYVRTAADLNAFLRRIDTFLSFAERAGLRPVMMSELRAAGSPASGSLIVSNVALSAPAEAI